MNNAASEDNALMNMKPEDYLEKQNIRKDLADAINLVLENRPENPIHFIYDYFSNHLDPSISNTIKEVGDPYFSHKLIFSMRNSSNPPLFNALPNLIFHSPE